MTTSATQATTASQRLAALRARRVELQREIRDRMLDADRDTRAADAAKRALLTAHDRALALGDPVDTKLAGSASKAAAASQASAASVEALQRAVVVIDDEIRGVTIANVDTLLRKVCVPSVKFSPEWSVMGKTPGSMMGMKAILLKDSECDAGISSLLDRTRL
jgi:hypothetical protein